MIKICMHRSYVCSRIDRKRVHPSSKQENPHIRYCCGSNRHRKVARDKASIPLVFYTVDWAQTYSLNDWLRALECPLKPNGIFDAVMKYFENIYTTTDSLKELLMHSARYWMSWVKGQKNIRRRMMAACLVFS